MYKEIIESIINETNSFQQFLLAQTAIIYAKDNEQINLLKKINSSNSRTTNRMIAKVALHLKAHNPPQLPDFV